MLAIGQALLCSPELLLVGELGSGLMRQEKEDVARFLLRIHYETETAVVWIEHDMQLVTEICNRMICLSSGRKIKEGTPEEVIADPKVIEAYLGKKSRLAPGE